MEKKIRKALRKMFGSRPVDPIRSLRDYSRCLYDEDGEGCKVYGFLPYGDMSKWDDEKVEEFINDWLRMPYKPSPYDCTGQIFTYWIDWHRNPDGWISYVHRLLKDV